jgi:predicted permease
MLVPASTGFDHPSFVKPAVLLLASALGGVAAFLTLAVICANLANLQLARAARRVHEVAIRLSLGCTRARLTRQMLTECVVLAVPGLLLALVIVQFAPAVESAMTPQLPFRVGFGTTADARLMMFTAAIALLAVGLFAMVPAWRASRVTSLTELIGAGRTTAGRPHRLRGVLMVSQLALSVVLLVNAGLFVRSLMVAREGDVGFDARNRLVISVNIGLQGYDAARGMRFYRDVIDRVRSHPGVEAAAWGFPVPFDTYGRTMALYVDGAVTRADDGATSTPSSVVSDGFVGALGMRLLSGRDFTAADTVGAPLAMIVSRTLASRLWPDGNALGRRARLNDAAGPEVTVVGIVANATFATIGDNDESRGYLALHQRFRGEQTLIVRTRDGSSTIVPAIKDIIADVDPALPTYGVSTLERNVDGGFASSRSAAALAGFFGTLALLISSIGLYALVAGAVAERTREIGVRLALGATPRAAMRLIMTDGARLGVIGLAIGLAGAMALARAVAGLLYGLSPMDPVTFLAVPILLIVVVLLATYLPARSTLKLDPMTVLRRD